MKELFLPNRCPLSFSERGSGGEAPVEGDPSELNSPLPTPQSQRSLVALAGLLPGGVKVGQIAILAGPSSPLISQQRQAGYRGALRKHSLP